MNATLAILFRQAVKERLLGFSHGTLGLEPTHFPVDFPAFYRLSHFAFYVVSSGSKFHFQLIFPAVTPSLSSVEAPLDAGHVAFEVIVR